MNVVRIAAACALLFAFPGRASPASDQELARSLVRTAKESFEAGEFAKAAELLTRAAVLAPTPATFYNLGRARERADDLAGAEAAYLDYLRLNPNANDRGAIEVTIASLHERLEQRRRLELLEREQAKRAEPRVVPAEVGRESAPPVRRAGFAWQLAGWASAGLGVVGVGVGVGLGLRAQDRHAAAVRAPELMEALGLQKMAEEAARGSTGSAIAGGLLLATGVALLIISHFLFPDAT